MRIANKLLKWGKGHAKVLAGVGVGLVVGGLSSAAVLASIPDANGVIHGCIRNNNGNLRIIDDATETCGGGQTPLNFNQTGPQGPPGSGGSVLVDDLAGADLTGTVMVGWDLSNKDFTGTNFTGATIGSADITGATFTGANFTSAQLLNNLDFEGYNLQNVQLGGHVTNVNFHNADLSNADFHYPAVQNSDFSGANLSNITFEGEYVGVNFTNANFSGAVFQGPSEGIQIANSNFTGADLTGIDVSIVVWDNVICPDGTNSDSHGDTCVGHLTP